jgi:hypothetical protein
MDSNCTLTFTYRPAIMFAARAKEWHKVTTKLDSPHKMGEPPMLVLLYSVLSLEAFISEQICDRGREQECLNLFNKNITLAVRWKKAIPLLKDPFELAQDAVDKISTLCGDTGQFGLLVRARHKLVHPQLTTEIGTNYIDSITDKYIDKFMKDVQNAPVSLPYFSAEFPGMLTCAASALWSMRTLATMIRLLFDAVGEDLPEEWSKLLSDYEVYQL